MASSDGPKTPPVRFPKDTTITFKPGQYRDTVEAFRRFGVYDKALAAMERNGVVIVLRSDNPDGVTNAIAEMQEALTGSDLFNFATRFMRVANPIAGRPSESEGCPIGKFLVAK